MHVQRHSLLLLHNLGRVVHAQHSDVKQLDAQRSELFERVHVVDEAPLKVHLQIGCRDLIGLKLAHV